MVSPSPLASDLLESVPHLRAFARCMVEDEELADRLVENVLVRAWNGGPGLWGRRLTIRLFGFLHHELRSCPGARGATASLGSRSSRHGSGAMAGLLHELPSHGREAVLLTSVCGFSAEEAAQICGCELSTLGTRLAEAVEQLLSRLDNCERCAENA